MLLQDCPIKEAVSILGLLTDVHIWDLAKRITSEEELEHLGRDVLQLPDYEFRSVMYNKKYALAAREILDLWRRNQYTAEDAYQNIYTKLRKHGWSQLAEELKLWTPGGNGLFTLHETGTGTGTRNGINGS